MTLLLTESFDAHTTSGYNAAYYNGKYGRYLTGMTGLQGGLAMSPSIAAGRHGNAMHFEGTHNIGPGGQLTYIYDEGMEHNTAVLGMAIYTNNTGFAWGTTPAVISFGEQRATGTLTHVQMEIVNTTVTMKRGDGTVLGSTFILANAQYFYMEIRVVVHDTTGVLEVRLDGGVVYSFTGDTRNGGTGNISSFVWSVGNGGGSSTGRYMNIDDVYLCSGAGNAPFNGGYLGDCTVEFHQPNANVSTQWTVTGAAANWDAVSDVVGTTAPVTTDYVSADTTDFLDLYTVPNIAAVSPNQVLAVATYAYADKVDSGARSLAMVLDQGGSQVQSSDFLLRYSANGGPFFYRYCRETATDGTAWSNAKRTSLRVGLKARP